ncbi:ARF/SAR superfamily protein [Cenococcum geophilum]
MWTPDWLWETLSWLGIGGTRAKLLFLGLDNAGKTTLLHMLKNGRATILQPALHPTCEDLTFGFYRFTVYDLGGHTQLRRLWPDFFPEASGVVFVVDAADPERVAESRVELDKLLAKKDMLSTPFLVLGNKTDDPNALSEDKLLGLVQTTGKGKVPLENARPIELFMCSVVERQGYDEGIRWLSQYL